MVDRIRKLSKERGKTIKDLEKECGIGNGSIAKWDDHCPRVSAVVDVAKALGVSLEVILGYGEKEEKKTEESA